MLTILNIGGVMVSWTVVAQLVSYFLIFYSITHNDDFYLLISYTFPVLAKINLIAIKQYKATPKISYTWMQSDTDFDAWSVLWCNCHLQHFHGNQNYRKQRKKVLKLPWFFFFLVAIHLKQNEKTDDVTLQNTFQFTFSPHLFAAPDYKGYSLQLLFS